MIEGEGMPRPELPQTIRFPLTHFEIEILGHTFELAGVEDVDALLDELIAKGPDSEAVKDEQIPYWADLWHAAIGMSHYLMGNTSLEGKTLLELGCGMGLCGIVAAHQGAQVVMTDYLPEAIDLAAYNWKLNRREEPEVRLLDWRVPDLALAADLVVASDVAYEERAHKPLINAFRTLVNPGGRILLSEPGRPHAASWLRSLSREGFKVDIIEFPVSYKNIDNLVTVYELNPTP
ncbi:MAG: methyltransferase domain-containing protein [Bacteroidota bacterium]